MSDDYRDEQDPAVGSDWRITDLSGADWALSRLADLDREVLENDVILGAAIVRLQMRHAALQARLNKGIAFFRSHLEAYATEHKAELLGGGKKKSRTLHHGSIGWRKAGGGLTVVDREALLAWARTQPVEAGMVRIKEEPAVDEVKRQFASTGECPPGCDVEPEREEIQIKAVREDAK